MSQHAGSHLNSRHLSIAAMEPNSEATPALIEFYSIEQVANTATIVAVSVM